MPTCACKEIIRPGMPGIFHCWSRCVRRAWLLGDDPLTGKNYDHRRLWILQRLQVLVASFAIDVGFLAILSNHFGLVLRATPRISQRWGAWEVARRWLRVYPGRQVLDGEKAPEPTEAEIEKLVADKERIEILRQRLGNVSWFMAAVTQLFPRLFRRLAGTAELLHARATAMGRKWVHGIRAARELFTSTPPP